MIIDTTAGRVSGLIEEGVHAFRTIPYARARRFCRPEPPVPWAGVRDCSNFAGRAPVRGIAPPTRPELERFSGVLDASPETEDCLALNVWTSSADPAARRPVMVWFHGGAWSWGNANSPRTRGTRLVTKHDVVVVCINQRLNIFGHLDLSDRGGDPWSGNAGTLDMIAALEWIRDNIAAFGGDPGNVTVFGESGGGAKVSVLLSMPRAKGLLHRGIIQSGACVRVRTRERALALTECVQRVLGSVSVYDAMMDQLLEAVGPATKALGAPSSPLFDRYAFGPVVDGDVIPEQPFDPVARDYLADVPVIIGDMKTETANYLAVVDKVWDRSLTEDEMVSHMRPIAGGDRNRVVALYRRLYPEMNPSERLIAMTTDSNFRIRSLVLAQRRAGLHRGPVWMYSFEWETPLFDGRLKAPHAMDVPFTFNTLDLTNATDGSADALRLADTMSSVWAGFARDGRPGPDWPEYDADTRATLMLDKHCGIENDPRGEERRLWQDITGTA